MKTLISQKGLAKKAGLSLILATALALAGGAAVAAATEDSGPRAARGGDTEAGGGAGDVRICSASSPGSFTGRQCATVSPSPRQPEICIRRHLGGVAPADLPDCWKMSRELGCVTVVDAD
jgi:hypothetical protein